MLIAKMEQDYIDYGSPLAYTDHSGTVSRMPQMDSTLISISELLSFSTFFFVSWPRVLLFNISTIICSDLARGNL